MKELLLNLVILILFSGCQNPSKSGIGQEEMIRIHLSKKNPKILEMPKGLNQVLEVVNLLHHSPQFIQSEPRTIYLTPAQHIEAILNDSSYGVLCGGFAQAVKDSLTALNYENRMVQMFRDRSDSNDNHIANEVKIYDEWVAVDATFNAIFTNSKGDFLSFEELKFLVDSGEIHQHVYINDSSNYRIEDNYNESYYITYESLLNIIRILPQDADDMPFLSTEVSGSTVID